MLKQIAGSWYRIHGGRIHGGRIHGGRLLPFDALEQLFGGFPVRFLTAGSQFGLGEQLTGEGAFENALPQGFGFLQTIINAFAQLIADRQAGFYLLDDLVFVREWSKLE